MERNKAILSLVFKLIKSDNKLEKIESQYLISLARELNISENEFNLVIANPDDYKLIPPPPEQERMEILYYLLFAMRIDKDINKSEENFIYNTGIKLGFAETMIKDMLNIFKKHLTTRLPKDALLDILKKYMN